MEVKENKNYREMTREESNEIHFACSNEELGFILQQYELQVFKVRSWDEYEGDMYFRYFLAGTVKDLAELKVLDENIERIVA